MATPQLIVCVDDLKQEVKEAMDRARKMGFGGIDVAAVSGPISPDELTHTGRRHLMKHLADLGLRLGSLRGPTGGPGFGDPVGGERRLETMARIVELAAGLGVQVVSMTLGQGGSAANLIESSRIKEALCVLADRADRAGVTVAVETAGIASAELSRLLGEINCPSLASCCDSGAMLMRGEDPCQATDHLPGRIRHVRARDAVVGTDGQGGHEAAMGQGSLDVPRFLAALEQAGFRGDIVLTRSGGDDPASELLRAKALFEQYLRRGA